MENLKNIIEKFSFLLTKSQKRKIKILILIIMFGMILESISIAIVFPVIKIITQNDGNKSLLYTFISNLINTKSKDNIIYVSLSLLIFVYFVKTFYMLYATWIQSNFAFSFQESISNKLYERYLKQNYTFHLERNSSQLISIATTETNAFTQAFLLPVLYIISELFILIGIIILVFVINPIGALIICLIMATTTFTFASVTKKRIIQWGKERQSFEMKRIQVIQEGLGGLKEIKILGCENDFILSYESVNSKSAELGKKISFLQNIPKQIIEFVSIISICVMVYFTLKLNKTFQELLPTLALFIASAFRMMPSINRIMSSLQSVRFSIPVVELLYLEFKNTEIKNDIKSHKEKIDFRDKIELKNITFSYDNKKNILNEIYLKINKGETIGIIGGSGAGKSTLIDILLGILNPQSGVIEIDNQNVNKDIRAWQNIIGYVPQNIYLLDNSFEKNVTLGESKINIEQLRSTLRQSKLEQVVANLDKGLKSNIGENGLKLSGGQRQRIGIARSLYRQPEILIFDEATSALDNETEAEVMSAIKNLKRSKTIIIIAHRISTLKDCDKIYELKNGSLIQVNEK